MKRNGLPQFCGAAAIETPSFATVPEPFRGGLLFSYTRIPGTSVSQAFPNACRPELATLREIVINGAKISFDPEFLVIHIMFR